MIYSNFSIESSLWSQGYSLIAGIDEVGRGCFAGPVVVGAVIFPQNSFLIQGLADSKLLKPLQRKSLAKEIKRVAQFFAIAEICVEDINKVGIGKATQMAFRKAVRSLGINPDFILIDAFYINHLDRKKQRAIKGGDRISATISAASIIAKDYRDSLMKSIHKIYPEYGFSKHKGYGTKLHQEMIKKYGLSKLHRTSFNLNKFL